MDLVGLKLPDICLKKKTKKLTQETCPIGDRTRAPLLNLRACYRLLRSGGLSHIIISKYIFTKVLVFYLALWENY